MCNPFLFNLSNPTILKFEPQSHHTPGSCWHICAQVSPELRDFICQLLDKNVMKRLDIQGALQVRAGSTPCAI